MKLDSLSDEEIAWLDDILQQHDEPDAIQNSSELDGFLTALVSGPVILAAEAWLPAIWGDGQPPAWQSAAQARRFADLVQQQLNFNQFLLVEHPDDFSALFFEEEQLDPVDWCYGYMRAVSLWPQADGLPEEINQLLDEIDYFALMYVEQGDEVWSDLTPAEQLVLINRVEPAALEIHDYYFKQRAAVESVKRDSPKVGRNDPCPCGSGKKYKQCCLRQH